MLPVTPIISCPYCGIALNPGIPCSSQHKCPFSLKQLLHSFIGCLTHKQAVYVVHFSMCFRIAGITVNYAGIHRFCRRIKNARLIHIVPYSTDSVVYIKLMKRSPPFTSTFIRKIREYAWTWPDVTNILFSIRCLAKTSRFKPLLVYLVPRLNFDSWVNNRHYTKTQLLQFTHHACWIRKAILIKSKYLILIHVMNIQINDVARNALGSEILRELDNFLLIHITESRLLIA
ncbi:hypothetical protein D3C73_567680 [compost metagenome]